MSDTEDTDPMQAEFDTAALWTAEAALALGPAHHQPAACRGSGGPPTLDWFVGQLRPEPGERLVDLGAGVGGPAAYAAERHGVRPLLVEPALGACRAARRLFDLPTACADAAALPLPDASASLLWCLGVLCTTQAQDALLGELRRVLAPGGRAGLLVFVADRPHPDGEPEGNHFPTRDELAGLLTSAGLHVRARVWQDGLGSAPPEWLRLDEEVDDHVRRQHGREPAWQAAEDERQAVGRLLADGTVRGLLLSLEPAR